MSLKTSGEIPHASIHQREKRRDVQGCWFWLQAAPLNPSSSSMPNISYHNLLPKFGKSKSQLFTGFTIAGCPQPAHSIGKCLSLKYPKEQTREMFKQGVWR